MIRSGHKPSGEWKISSIKQPIQNNLNTLKNSFLVEPEKQKDLLHSIITKITVNAGNNPKERSVKDIELFFDASLKDDFVLTYGKIHLIGHNGETGTIQLIAVNPGSIFIVENSIQENLLV